MWSTTRCIVHPSPPIYFRLIQISELCWNFPTPILLIVNCQWSLEDDQKICVSRGKGAIAYNPDVLSSLLLLLLPRSLTLSLLLPSLLSPHLMCRSNSLSFLFWSSLLAISTWKELFGNLLHEGFPTVTVPPHMNVPFSSLMAFSAVLWETC